MVNRGWLHHVPSEGNITLSGELMDFEDVSRFDDHEEILRSWKFMRESFSSRGYKVDTLSNYLSLTLGVEFLGEFGNSFLVGAGLGTSPNHAASNIIDLQRDKLGRLVDLSLN